MPKPFRKRHPVLFWLGLPLLVLAVLGAGGALFGGEDSLPASDRLAMLRVEGVILQNRPILKWIDRLYRDDSVKGVLLRVDSPGGGAAASQELHEAIARLQTKKPVVAYMGSVAASGGLMVALAAPMVVANPSAVTGSIGVKMDIPQVQGLMAKLGVGQETLTTGRFKDAGSPFKVMSAQDRTYLQGVLQDMHRQFVELVAKSRNMPLANVEAMADGRIFTGREALALGLVNAVGGQDVALEALSKATGLASSQVLLEQPKESALWKEILETVLDIDLSSAARSPAFMYMY
ncbi:MAG: signal peptide peptidase SppA [Desulfovibrionaceae bacterium]